MLLEELGGLAALAGVQGVVGWQGGGQVVESQGRLSLPLARWVATTSSGPTGAVQPHPERGAQRPGQADPLLAEHRAAS